MDFIRNPQAALNDLKNNPKKFKVDLNIYNNYYFSPTKGYLISKY